MLMNHSKGREILLEVADILDKIHVPFFLMQGTALGAYRDKGFTPTERDIDIGVLLEKFPTPYVINRLVKAGYDVEAFVAPFRFIRTVIAWKHCIHIDIVGMIPFQDKRYTFGPPREWTIAEPYALVHDKEIIETTEPIELFGRTFQIPSPIGTYLEREYGPDWRTPKDDHTSRTRVYNFLQDNNIA